MEETKPDDSLVFGGGSFRSAALEACFETEHLPETRRHARFIFAAAALLNAMFLPVDWRFYGSEHFWLAVPARLAVIATALMCLALVRGPVSAARLTRATIGWMAGTAIGVGALVSSHSTLAQFVVILLPVVYYLSVPVPFRWSLIGGAGCSAALMTGYMILRPFNREGQGMILALLVLNVALAMSVTRSSRLARREWMSARSARRLGDMLAVSRAALERMFLASPVPLVLTSNDAEGRVLAMSRTSAALLGQERPSTLRQFYAEEGIADPLAAALSHNGGTAEIEVAAILADGSRRTLLIKSTEIELPEHRAILSGIVDITERKAAQANLEQIAATDALTGLRSRLSFFAAARVEMTRSTRAHTMLSLLMVDIDHFKAINDTHGHFAGDAVLRDFAKRARAALGPDAIVGRLGGEEFAILLPDASPHEARRRAERLRETIADARTVAGGSHIAITISVGVSGVLPLERDLDQSLARADRALYTAKRSGRNRVMVDLTGDDRVAAQG